jgi:hypothetical protein
MSQSPTSARRLPLKNNDDLQETYADALVAVNVTNGNFHFTFVNVRSDHSVEPPSTYRYVTTRLVVPAACAMEMQETIARVVSDLQQKEILPRPAPIQSIRH